MQATSTLNFNSKVLITGRIVKLNLTDQTCFYLLVKEIKTDICIASSHSKMTSDNSSMAERQIDDTFNVKKIKNTSNYSVQVLWRGINWVCNIIRII